MPTFRFVIEYDGTEFRGWQRQAGEVRTVQGVFEAALARVGGCAVAVAGAGRTDAGVHAEGQVASARFETRLDPETLRRALNAVLPRDVAVLGVSPAPDSFHARRDALAKLYAYRIWNGATRSPLRERRWLHVPARLDRAALRAALAELVGTHDFASFQAAGSRPGPTVRRIDRAALIEDGDALRIELEGSGFLRHMVRNAVGTLLEVGSGRRAPDSIPALLAARDRARAGPTAAPQGLTLVRVRHRDFPSESEPLQGERVDGGRAHG